MAGILFIVNVPKKDYETHLKINNLPNSIFETEKITKVSKVIDELKEKQLCYKSVNKHAENDNGIVLKCKSTDCLHENNNESDLNDVNSETVIDGGLANSGKSFVWDDIKQMLKLNKNKLKINRPVRSVDVLRAFSRDTPLETILSEIVSRLDIKNAAWNSTRDDKFWQVTFSLEKGSLSEELLQVLRTFGIGSRHQSSVSLLPCALYYKSDEQLPTTNEIEGAVHHGGCNTAWSRFSSSVGDRNNLAQVLHDVRRKGALTFDWVFLLFVAAFVASIGLIENSTVFLVASVLLSPLMGPITAGTLGTAVRDRSLQVMGVKNELLGLSLVVVVGFVVGLIICAIDDLYGVAEVWPTNEMFARCAYRSLWIGVLIALPSGAACALAVLGDHTASIVGVAISAALLPPAVNAGLLWSMSLTSLIANSEKRRWRVVDPSELALLGTASFCLTLVNIVCVFLAGITVYKVKKVSPLDRRDISWWRANKDRLHVKRQQSKDDSLNWDAYTQWCTNSLERNEKENTVEKEKETKAPCTVDNDTITFRRRPSIIRRFRTQNLEAYCNRIQLEDNYISLNPHVNKDLERQIEELAKADTLKKSDEGNSIRGSTESEQPREAFAAQGNCPQTTKSILETNADMLHRYYNLAYDNDESRQKSDVPIIEPSSSVTVVNNTYGSLNDRVIQV